eukprot:m.628932 g.628932  ORF g.628932 m.628932 type:complete len:486 (-) comp58268_c0_seq19:105-1562(-)
MEEALMAFPDAENFEAEFLDFCQDVGFDPHFESQFPPTLPGDSWISDGATPFLSDINLNFYESLSETTTSFAPQLSSCRCAGEPRLPFRAQRLRISHVVLFPSLFPFPICSDLSSSFGTAQTAHSLEQGFSTSLYARSSSQSLSSLETARCESSSRDNPSSAASRRSYRAQGSRWPGESSPPHHSHGLPGQRSRKDSRPSAPSKPSRPKDPPAPRTQRILDLDAVQQVCPEPGSKQLKEEISFLTTWQERLTAYLAAFRAKYDHPSSEMQPGEFLQGVPGSAGQPEQSEEDPAGLPVSQRRARADKRCLVLLAEARSLVAEAKAMSLPGSASDFSTPPISDPSPSPPINRVEEDDDVEANEMPSSSPYSIFCDNCEYRQIGRHNPAVFIWHRNIKALANVSVSGPLSRPCDICGGHLEAKVVKKQCGFTCYRCNLVLHSSDRLIAHASQHTGHKPFSCSVCSRSFSRKPRLLAHFARFHGGKPSN